MPTITTTATGNLSDGAYLGGRRPVPVPAMMRCSTTPRSGMPSSPIKTARDQRRRHHLGDGPHVHDHRFRRPGVCTPSRSGRATRSRGWRRRTPPGKSRTDTIPRPPSCGWSGRPGRTSRVRDLQFTNGGNNGGGIVVADLADFLRVGTATHFAVSPIPGGLRADLPASTTPRSLPAAGRPGCHHAGRGVVGIPPGRHFVLRAVHLGLDHGRDRREQLCRVGLRRPGRGRSADNDFDAFVNLYSAGFDLTGNIYRAAWELDGVIAGTRRGPGRRHWPCPGPPGGALSVASGELHRDARRVVHGDRDPGHGRGGYVRPGEPAWAGTSEAKTFTYTPRRRRARPHDDLDRLEPGAWPTRARRSPMRSGSAERPFARCARHAMPSNRAGATSDNQGGPAKFVELVAYPAPLAGAEMHNHYDPIYVYWRSNAGRPRPRSMRMPSRSALYQYRDMFIRPSGGGVQGYHVNSLGLRMHYEHTGDPLSRDGVLQPEPLGLRGRTAYSVADPIEGTHAIWTSLREIGLCRSTPCSTPSGSGVAHRTRCDQLAGDVHEPPHPMVDPAFTATWWEAGVPRLPQPFMLGLTLRALIQYWDRYRDAVVPGIPAAVKAGHRLAHGERLGRPDEIVPLLGGVAPPPMSANPVVQHGRYSGPVTTGRPADPLPGPEPVRRPRRLRGMPATRGTRPISTSSTRSFIGSPGGRRRGRRRSVPTTRRNITSGISVGPAGARLAGPGPSPPAEATTYTLARMGSGPVRANHLAVQLVVDSPRARAGPIR